MMRITIGEDLMGIKTATKRALSAAGFELRRITGDERRITDRAFACAIEYHSYSKSEFLQDIFVLAALRQRRNGFFVEFGAFDGITWSNTYMLEKKLGWAGILAEPNRTFAREVLANRPSCVFDSRCVWSATGDTISFTETTECRELSTVTQFAQSDYHDRTKKNPIEYQVETISLADLLVQHKSPAEIDYLSIDTEGSELTILRAFDFNRWRFNVITVEHNWVQSARDGIHFLLTSHGYTRVLTEFSQCDDWYIRNGLQT
jgi:FkbM family methyltransferase